MTTDKIVITIFGLSLSAFIYYFFQGRKEKSTRVKTSVDIAVSGGYTPEVIEVPVGRPTTLNFILKSRSHCLEEIVLPDFRKKAHLEVGAPYKVVITPPRPGEYIYSCGMNMYHGKIIAK